MTLSELQQTRIKYHLGLSPGEPSITQLQQDRGLLLGALSAETELTIVGDITTNPLDVTHFYVAGTPIAAQYSILHEVETSFRRTGTEQIDPSLFVSQAGSVKLRGSELRKRKQHYRHWQDQLALALNYRVIPIEGFNRVGYR